MSIKRHGLAIGIDRIGSRFLLSLKAVGTLTHEDYQRITPMLEAALAEVSEPRIRVLVDASELDGWELRAAWDDLRLSLRHGSEFDKVAIYGHGRWQELASKVGSWFISGEVRFFTDYEAAIAWVDA